MFEKSSEEFFEENFRDINKKLSVVMIWVLVLPVIFLVLTLFGIFDVSIKFCIFFLIFNIFIVGVFSVINHATDHYKLAAYVGLLIGPVDVAVLGICNDLAMTITYGLFQLISLHYYSRKITRISLFAGYVLVSASIFIKSTTIIEVLNFKGRLTPMSWAIPTFLGYTIEYIFFWCICEGISARTEKTMRELIESNDERNLILEKLRKKNKQIEKINTSLESSNEQLNVTQLNVVQFVAQVLGSHDLFTGRHVYHTQKYVEMIAKEIRSKGFYTEELTDENIELFRSAAFLHDIGKVHIPEGILNKPGKFTPEEYELMKSHPGEGLKLLQFLPKIGDGSFNEIAKQMAYCHHEKWDGTGYPRGIKGTDIPLCARIMAAADVLDALISERLYKDPMSIEDAVKLFEELKGHHFEPCIADAVISLKYSIEIEDSKFKQEENSSNFAEKEWWLRYHENLAKEQQQRAASTKA